MRLIKIDVDKDNSGDVCSCGNAVANIAVSDEVLKDLMVTYKHMAVMANDYDTQTGYRSMAKFFGNCLGLIGAAREECSRKKKEESKILGDNTSYSKFAATRQEEKRKE